MLESVRGLVVFAHVAESKSFSRAAERLGITRSAVSKHVAQLEAALGVQLLVRTTRKLALTEAGERVYASSARIAGDLEAAQDAAHAESSLMAGALRVTAPFALGRHYLMPVLSEFLALHPKLSIELVVSDRFVDLVDDRIDCALRVGGRTDPNLVSRKICGVELAIVAAPSYLARRGTPRSPSELVDHEWVVHAPSGEPGRVVLRRGKRAASVRMHGRLRCNDGLANVAAACAGMGMLPVPDFEVAEELRDGRLVRVLPQWSMDPEALHLVFPPRRHVLGRVRAFADFIADRFKRPPWQLPR